MSDQIIWGAEARTAKISRVKWKRVLDDIFLWSEPLSILDSRETWHDVAARFGVAYYMSDQESDYDWLYLCIPIPKSAGLDNKELRLKLNGYGEKPMNTNAYRYLADSFSHLTVNYHYKLDGVTEHIDIHDYLPPGRSPAYFNVQYENAAEGGGGLKMLRDKSLYRPVKRSEIESFAYIKYYTSKERGSRKNGSV